jgi:tRNA (mo5U34)-methyltransferase
VSALDTLQSRGASKGPLAQHILALGPWFQNVHLPDGSQTAPDHPLGDFPACKWERLAPHLPEDLSGRSVLDIGCNAGYYSIELARRGARVVAMDHDPHYLVQAQWVARQFGLDRLITFRLGDVYSLADQVEHFDVVLFLGVFYHLRYPLLGLDLAAAASRELLLFQSLSMPGGQPAAAPEDPGFLGRDQLCRDDWPKLAFIEESLAGDPTNWWVPNPAALDAMIRSTGFEITARPEPDTCVCRRTAQAATARNRLEQTLALLRQGQR